MKRNFKVTSKTVKYKNPWMTVIELATESEGKSGIYGVIEREDSAILVVESIDRKILLVKQYRYPTNSYSWELPMGGINEGELPLSGAIRELEEEAGCQVALTKIGEFHPVPGLTPQKAFVFYGQVSMDEIQKIHDYNQDIDEIIDRKFFSYDEIDSMIRNNEITDGFTLSSLSVWRCNKNA